MSGYVLRSAFWDQVNEQHRPRWTRAETALLLSDLRLPDLPSTATMREARDAVVALLGRESNAPVSDDLLLQLGRIRCYMGTYDPMRHGVVNAAAAHVAWDFEPMDRRDKRDWDAMVRDFHGGDEEQAAMRQGHRYVIPRGVRLLDEAMVAEERSVPSAKRKRMMDAFADAERR